MEATSSSIAIPLPGWALLRQQIDAVLYDAFGQDQISPIYQTLNQYYVVMEVDPKYQMTPDALKSVYVITSTGAQVPLSTFAHFAPAITALAGHPPGTIPCGYDFVQSASRRVDLGTATRVIEPNRDADAPAGHNPRQLPRDGRGLSGLAFLGANC